MDVAPTLSAWAARARGADWPWRARIRRPRGLRAGFAGPRRLLPGLGLLRRRRGRGHRVPRARGSRSARSGSPGSSMGVGLVGWIGGGHLLDPASWRTTQTRPTPRSPTPSTWPSIRRATSPSFLLVRSPSAVVPQQPVARRRDRGAHRGRSDRRPRSTSRSSTPPAAAPRTIAVNLAYPVGDLLLLGLVVAIFGLNGWRPGRAGSCSGRAGAERAGRRHLPGPAAKGTYVEGTVLDALWPARSLLVALAAWQPTARKTLADPRTGVIMAVPVGCGLVAVRLLVYDHFQRVNAPRSASPP